MRFYVLARILQLLLAPDTLIDRFFCDKSTGLKQQHKRYQTRSFENQEQTAIVQAKSLSWNRPLHPR